MFIESVHIPKLCLMKVYIYTKIGLQKVYFYTKCMFNKLYFYIKNIFIQQITAFPSYIKMYIL